MPTILYFDKKELYFNKECFVEIQSIFFKEECIINNKNIKYNYKFIQHLCFMF